MIDSLNRSSVQACAAWKEEGQCDKNPRFMHYGCRQSCGSCFKPDVEVRSPPPSHATAASGSAHAIPKQGRKHVQAVSERSAGFLGKRFARLPRRRGGTEGTGTGRWCQR